MTIIEMLVVVLIIGIIVMVAIPTFAGTGRTAQDGVCAGNLRLIDGVLPLSVADLVSADTSSPCRRTRIRDTPGIRSSAATPSPMADIRPILDYGQNTAVHI